MNERMFDVFSYARRDPGRRDRLSPAQIEKIARTTWRVPEAVVKVLAKAPIDAWPTDREWEQEICSRQRRGCQRRLA
jgi:hypothetical protein